MHLFPQSYAATQTEACYSCKFRPTRGSFGSSAAVRGLPRHGTAACKLVGLANSLLMYGSQKALKATKSYSGRRPGDNAFAQLSF